VLVVDEAGMVATRQLAELLDHVARADGKLVLVGDHRQLPELAAGGAFRGLVQRGLAVELGENVRQINSWEREALDHLRAGRSEVALALYADRGALIVEPTTEDARERLVNDWLDVGDADDSVMIAQRRTDVADLNARARARLRELGSVAGRELELPGGAFAAGDRVVVKRNDLRRGVHNGQRGRVVDVDPDAGSITLASNGRVVELDRSFLLGVTRDGDPTLLHGYAITGHVAQGLTVDHAFVLASEGIRREWAYVALSRGRLSNRLYVASIADGERAEFAPVERPARDPVERLASSLRESGGQVLAIDSGLSIASERRMDAERAAELAARELRTLERRRQAWLPGRRRQIDAARDRVRAADAELATARRVESELRHTTRPFVTERELDVRADRRCERIAERATERILQRGRDLGREL
jgi:ATP-dependent exoDNAse (exonuclease V) alpha subunit